MSWLILESNVVAESLDVSREFFRLSRPVGVAEPDDVTKFWSATIVHPTTGEVALNIPAADFLVNALSSDKTLPAALFDGRISAPDRAQMESNIAGARLGRSTMAALLPSGLQGDIKSDSFMEAQGWFGGALLVDLISFWELEEASGTRFDAHGTNDLTDVNTVGQAIGKVGNAANFVRANGEKLRHVTNASLETGNIDFSFALWVRPTLKTVALNILYKGIDNPAKEYGLRYENTIDRFRWVTANGSSDRIVDANTFGAPTQGDWHFIVVFHDKANNEIGIGINNGAFDIDVGGFAPVVQAKSFVIGEAGTASAAFDGDIDQVGFWKRILVPAEITFLYNNGNGRSFAEISDF